MELLRWFAGADILPRMERDLLWGSATLLFSLLLALGYVVIAFKWYLQRRTTHSAESRRAAWRLAWLAVASAVCGGVFFAMDMPWALWRAYDLALLALAIYTWTVALRMRGLSLVEQRMAEMRDLQRAFEKYREMSDHLPHMVWTAANDGSIDFVNLRWAEFVGGQKTWLEVLHPDDEPVTVARWRAAVAAPKALRMEVRLRGLDGYRTFLLTATPLVRGGAVRWLGACADIEDQKRLVDERERQTKQRVFMLNSLGHDLRAPLNAVALNAQLLKMSSHDPEVLETATLIADSARAAGALVTKLLEYARLGASDENEMGSVSVAAVLAQVEKRFAPVAQGKGVTLHVSATPDEFEVYTDRLKLERILNNLLDNAVKFTNRGVIAVEALREGDDTAVFRVSDTGVGVPEPHVPYLFNEFYQVNNHERDQTKGFGMGLAICRCLSRQLGGDVRLARTGAGGSTFELILPGHDPHRGGRPAGEAGALSHAEDAPVCGA